MAPCRRSSRRRSPHRVTAFCLMPRTTTTTIVLNVLIIAFHTKASHATDLDECWRRRDGHRPQGQQIRERIDVSIDEQIENHYTYKRSRRTKRQTSHIKYAAGVVNTRTGRRAAASEIASRAATRAPIVACIFAVRETAIEVQKKKKKKKQNSA